MRKCNKIITILKIDNLIFVIKLTIILIIIITIVIITLRLKRYQIHKITKLKDNNNKILKNIYHKQIIVKDKIIHRICPIKQIIKLI